MTLLFLLLSLLLSAVISCKLCQLTNLWLFFNDLITHYVYLHSWKGSNLSRPPIFKSYNCVIFYGRQVVYCYYWKKVWERILESITKFSGFYDPINWCSTFYATKIEWRLHYTLKLHSVTKKCLVWFYFLYFC